MTPYERSERLKALPPYIFLELDRAKKELLEAGKDVISLAIGDPDLPTPSFVVDALKEAAANPLHQKYPLDAGWDPLRQEIARWFKSRFNVSLQPNEEILPLIGSKEGIAHFPMAYLNPGDIALMPNPGYPAYFSGTIFSGAQPHYLSLTPENHFLADLKSVDKNILKKAKLLYLCYPNSPTGACATRAYYQEIVKLAHEYHWIVVNDAAYSEIAFNGTMPISFLETPGAKEVGIEFHSFSKTFNMTGWRLGWACGSSDLIKGLLQVKANVDSGVFQAIQVAGVRALQKGGDFIKQNAAIYKKRRDVMADGLKKLGFEFEIPEATFYMWIKTPKKMKSADFCIKILKETNVIFTPGNGFGSNGEGYFRIALTVPEERIKEALNRLSKAL
jgi:LL-diaminopimelate aminotransferase